LVSRTIPEIRTTKVEKKWDKCSKIHLMITNEKKKKKKKKKKKDLAFVGKV
jgi:hypothetical protein